MSVSYLPTFDLSFHILTKEKQISTRYMTGWMSSFGRTMGLMYVGTVINCSMLTTLEPLFRAIYTVRPTCLGHSRNVE